MIEVQAMGLLVAIKRNVGSARRCPKCGGTNARLRSKFSRAKWPLRCLSCKMTFGRLHQRECPFCGSRNARTRQDWHRRNNPLRCRTCLSVWGGTVPKAGKKLSEVIAAREPEDGEPCGACDCCLISEHQKWTGGYGSTYESTCGRCGCCRAREHEPGKSWGGVP